MNEHQPAVRQKGRVMSPQSSAALTVLVTAGCGGTSPTTVTAADTGAAFAGVGMAPILPDVVRVRSVATRTSRGGTAAPADASGPDGRRGRTM